MTPEQRLLAKIVFVILLFVGVFFAGFGVRGYMATHEATLVALEASKATTKTLGEYLDKVDERDAQIAQLQDSLATRDRESTKALTDAQAENDRLRADAITAQRMRFTGAVCPKQEPAVGAAATAGSVGDAAGVELSPEARQDVFNLRSGITTTEAQVTYLQGYTTDVLAWIKRQRWCGAQ